MTDHFPRTSIASPKAEPEPHLVVPLLSAEHRDLLAKISEAEQRLARYRLTIRKQRDYIHDLEELLRSYGHAI